MEKNDQSYHMQQAAKAALGDIKHQVILETTSNRDATFHIFLRKNEFSSHIHEIEAILGPVVDKYEEFYPKISISVHNLTDLPKEHRRFWKELGVKM